MTPSDSPGSKIGCRHAIAKVRYPQREITNQGPRVRVRLRVRVSVSISLNKNNLGVGELTDKYPPVGADTTYIAVNANAHGRKTRPGMSEF